MVVVEGQFLKALMERFAHPGMASVIQTLPPELASAFQELPERVGKAPELFFIQPKRVLGGMHPSWCEELVQLSPPVLQPLIRQLVLEAVGKEKTEETISDPVRQFLLRYAISKWPERSIQGVESIEGASLQWLAAYNEQTLYSLAELLAVNNVVDIVRQIVDKKVLQKILASLTVLQQKYLRSVLHRPVRSATLNKELTALLIDDPVTGAQTLLKQGFEELGHAIKSEPQLLQWHVLHHIDREKAIFLKGVMESKISSGEEAEIKKRLFHAYQFLKKVETQ